MTEYFNNDADADLEADSTTLYDYDRLGRVSTIVQQTIAGSTSAVRYKSATYAYNATTGQLSTLTRYAYDPVNYTVPDYPISNRTAKIPKTRRTTIPITAPSRRPTPTTIITA